MLGRRVRWQLRRGALDLRALVLLIPAALVFSQDLPAMATLLYSISAVLALVGVSHIVRRVLFHYVDLESVALRASDGTTGAGLVFLGGCIFLSAVLLSAVMWVAR